MLKFSTSALALLPLCVATPALAAEADQMIIVTAPTLTDAAELRAASTDIVGYEDYADKSIV